MSEMMNENGAPVMEWSYGGRGDDISSSLSLDTVGEPQGFMTIDRPVQIFKDASPMMAFVTLLRPLYAKTGEDSSSCRFPTPTDVQRLPPSAGYLGVQVNAGLFFHGAKPTHYKDRDGQMKPIDGGTVLQNITVLHRRSRRPGRRRDLSLKRYHGAGRGPYLALKTALGLGKRVVYSRRRVCTATTRKILYHP